MSTLPEYTRYGLMAGWQSPSARPDLSRISQSATDEYDGFVVLNKQNGGSTISNSVAWADDFGTQFTPHYNGCVSDNFELFNFSDRDFTVRMQFGIGQYYAYNDLEGEQTIPLLFVDTGDGIVSTSPFSLYMVNAGNPNGVQQGDLVFSVFDTNGNQAYCHISSSNYYLPTYPGCWHVEVSRKGQQFTFKLTAYDSGEVIRVVRNTFPSFGKIAPASGIIRLLTFVDYGTVNNVFYGLQITDGVSRDTGGNSVLGRYATGRAYPSKSVRQRTKFELINAPLVGVVAGHTVNERIAGALRVALQDAIWGQYEYVNGTLGVDVPCIFATLTYAPYDYESVTKYIDYDFTDSDTLTVSGGYVTAVTDKSGNGRNATAVGGGPALTSGAINGLQAVTISSGRYLNLSTHLLSLIDGGNKFYVVVVYKPVYNSAGYKPILLQQNVVGSGWRYFGVYETFASSSSHYSEFIYSGTNYVQKSTYGWQYVIYEADPSTLKLGRVDGEEVFSVTPGAVGAYTGTPSAYIGGDADSSEPTYFNGQIARLSIIEAESLDMEGVEQWIARTFDIPVPEDHKYYGYFYPVDDEISCTDTSSPTGNLLTNDVAIECTLSVSAVNGQAGNVGVAQTLTNGTVVTINSDGSYTIDPTGCNTSGGDVVDTLEYSVSNGDAEASATLTVTVAASATPEWHPSELFASGESGGCWDLTDKTKLWADTAYTVRPSADGDLIYGAEDISGVGPSIGSGGVYPPMIYRASGDGAWLDGASDVLRILPANFSVAFAYPFTIMSAGDPTGFPGVGASGVTLSDMTSGSKAVFTLGTDTTTTGPGIAVYNSTYTGGSCGIAPRPFVAISTYKTGSQQVVDDLGHTSPALNIACPTNLKNLTVGGLRRSTTNGPYAGKYFCALIINRELTEAEKTALFAWAKTKAGIE